MGIATTSVFTASLSSSLTSAALPGKTSLTGLQVALYNLLLRNEPTRGLHITSYNAFKKFSSPYLSHFEAICDFSSLDKSSSWKHRQCI